MSGNIPYSPNYIDLFAGCGGLSLGLMKAGWQGLFAIEKSPMAFETLHDNLIAPATCWCFNWPGWLPQAPFDIVSFLEHYTPQLRELRGQISLVAGGPPCQGFSFAGRRSDQDERNRLVDKYLEVVELVQPDLVLLENVRGITVAFDTVAQEGDVEERHEVLRPNSSLLSAAEEIKNVLAEHYFTFDSIIRAVAFGVPQFRPRYIMIAVKKTLLRNMIGIPSPFQTIEAARYDLLQSKRLSLGTITVSEAISDLEKVHGVVPDYEMPRFQRGLYGPSQNVYQRLLRVDRDGNPIGVKAPDSHRFANHREATQAKFSAIMQKERGKQLSDKDRQELGIGKHAVTPLGADKPSHTLTTLPDDLIHYSEPRILTVRENARLQSFPDWFEFRGKYTTGNTKRREEVPRYTQVGNAVPPLMAEGIGHGLLQYYRAILDGELPPLQPPLLHLLEAVFVD